MKTDYHTKQYLIRSYYFAEAMALYELYYRPLVETYAPARTELVGDGASGRRPGSTVPDNAPLLSLSGARRVLFDVSRSVGFEPPR